MAPTTTCCSKQHCPARGQTGQGHIGIHAQKEQRCICHACHQTCSARKGTVFYRLRTSAETVGLVVTWLAPGCPPQAMVAALGFDERTVAAWWARSGRQGQAVHASLGAPPRDLGQGQADARRVKTQGGSVWLARAMMVKTRVWLGGEGSAPRDMPLRRRRSERVRRWATPRPLLGCIEGLCSYIRAMRETFRDPGHTGLGGRPRLRAWRQVLSAPVGKRYERRRVVETACRLGDGTPARVETLRCRSQGEGVSNTASIARLNATFRERLAPLARRCRALARHTLTLHEGRVGVGTVENFGAPHASVSHAPKTTPARAAGITDHGWTIHALLALHVPLSRWVPPTRRGRPSGALQHLSERWCA